jgi:hypothetical protein
MARKGLGFAKSLLGSLPAEAAAVVPAVAVDAVEALILSSGVAEGLEGEARFFLAINQV